jgi:hypothetical protein
VAAAPSILRFAVHDPGLLGPGAEDAAHLIGADDGPLRGRVRFHAAGIRCGFADEIAALALPVRAGAAGSLFLQTCLLPPREEPYGLFLELARHRIKHFIQKCEEWQMWDPALSRGAMAMWDEARAVFATALLSNDLEESERLACSALEQSIEASERLADAHAEILLHRRFGTRAAGSIVLGAVVATERAPTGRVERLLADELDVVAVPMPWRLLEPAPGRHDYAAVDRWIEWAQSRRRPVMAGPLVDLREEALPPHVRDVRDDYRRFRDLAYDQVDRIVARYGAAVGIWNVGRGFHANEWLSLDAEQMIDLARRTILAVRQRQRKANTLVELGDAFGVGEARRPGALPPWRYLELLQQDGIPFSAAGVRFIPGADGEWTRDLFQMSATLDRFLGRESRLLVSGFAAPSCVDGLEHGWWKGGWTREIQAEWAGRFAAIALSKPFVETLFWATAADDQDGSGAGRGLLDAAGRDRPVLSRLLAFRRALRRPLGQRRADPGAGS